VEHRAALEVGQARPGGRTPSKPGTAARYPAYTRPLEQEGLRRQMTVPLTPHAPQDRAASAPAAVPEPQDPGTTGLAAMLSFFSRLPLMAGLGAITAICGMLDAATFLGLGHVFAETMNGNIVLLAFTVGTHGISGLTSSLPDVLPYMVVLACFAAGAVAGGRLVRRDGETGRRIGFASDASLIGIAAVVIALTHPGPAGQARYLVIGILAVAMGLQNVLIRRWGISDLATNAMTKTMAYLVADSALGGGDNHHAMRRGASIVVFAVGAAVGALLIRYGVLWPILTSFTLFVLALPSLPSCREAPASQ
jgi:uncharacterized membrane protein YoaK (UPF0700 family)